MPRYLVAGLTVDSEIPLPELMPYAGPGGKPDVEIRTGRVPGKLPAAAGFGAGAETAVDEVLFRVPDVGGYHVKAGRKVLVEPADNVRARDLRLFLLGSAFGAIYLQRGFFPLHASVVVVKDTAVALTGDSGAGKSTMLAWMHRHGYPLLCDDVCVVRFDAGSAPLAYPGFPRLKLWQDALRGLGMDSEDLQRDYSRADKYHLAVSERFCTDPVPLRHINFLRFSDSGDPPCIEDISQAHAVALLRDNTYRGEYISGLGLTRSHFLDCVRLAKSVEAHFLVRPRDLSLMSACQHLIETQVA